MLRIARIPRMARIATRALQLIQNGRKTSDIGRADKMARRAAALDSTEAAAKVNVALNPSAFSPCSRTTETYLSRNRLPEMLKFASDSIKSPHRHFALLESPSRIERLAKSAGNRHIRKTPLYPIYAALNAHPAPHLSILSLMESYLPVQTVPLGLFMGTPTALPYSVQEPSYCLAS
jgi:hypothetical protein